MATRLRERGFACVQTPLPATGFTYDLVTCLNVLDRTERPLSLLRRLRELLTPSGVLLVGGRYGEIWGDMGRYGEI